MCVIPGIGLTVILPGHNVFEKLPSCHPERNEKRETKTNSERERGEGEG
jgi:hypothetical protein